VTIAANATPDEAESLRPRLTLLLGQSFFLGLTLGLLIVAAISLLLSTFGAQALPYVYIVVAVLGATAFYGFAEAQRRWSLIQVATVTEVIVVVFLALTWAGLVFAGAAWLAFPAMVAWSLIIQVGFVILGGQAGRLLDVREIKRYFPRVVSGFVMGFMVAGVLVGPLQRWLGGTAYLLLAAAVSASLMLAVLLLTNARYRHLLSQAAGAGSELPAPPLRQLLVKRFVLLIFLYQMLSAMGSQLLDFMALSASGARFADSETLAQFWGAYTFFFNLADLLFLVLVAGFLLSRFGLRFGIAANPGLVILMLLAIVVVGLVAGPGVTLFFWLVILARSLDLLMTDGATRTSINAAYQALPPRERLAVQTGVEGIGVPLALGLTGVVLIIFSLIEGLTVVHIAGFTLVVSLLWLAAGLLTYRGYADNLLQTLRRRALGSDELILDDASSLGVIERLLESNRLSDVRLALDMLEGAEHPSLSGHLAELVRRDEADIRIEALVRIEARREAEALPLVRDLLDSDAEPAVRGAALQACCALDPAGAVAVASPYLDSPEPALNYGAAVGLLRYGQAPGEEAVSPWLANWSLGITAAGRDVASSEPADRRILARVLGQAGSEHHEALLRPLLSDPDTSVRLAALEAAGRLKHVDLLPEVVANLDSLATRSAALEALVAYGERVLPLVEEALSGPAAAAAAAKAAGAIPSENALRLVRLCGQVKGEAVITLMLQHLDHPSNAMRDQIVAVLSACEFRAAEGELPLLTAALSREAEQGLRLLIAQEDIGDGEATEQLNRALEEELNQARRRAFLLLSFIYEARPMLRAEIQLDKGSGAERALVLEMLDVTLSSNHKALAFPLVDLRLTRTQRIQQLSKALDAPSLTGETERDERLSDLIQVAERSWAQPWTRACAIYAAGQLGVSEAAPTIETALADPDPTVRETAAWSLNTLHPEQFALHHDTLMEDEDPLVARLATRLKRSD
jgi:AAA family ATP:ADP antiporter